MGRYYPYWDTIFGRVFYILFESGSLLALGGLLLLALLFVICTVTAMILVMNSFRNNSRYARWYGVAILELCIILLLIPKRFTSGSYSDWTFHDTATFIILLATLAMTRRVMQSVVSTKQ